MIYVVHIFIKLFVLLQCVAMKKMSVCCIYGKCMYEQWKLLKLQKLTLLENADFEQLHLSMPTYRLKYFT